jgi:hypothetical protein
MPRQYKNPVRTSRETHYVSATESSRLMLYKIWRFDGSDYEECRLLLCDCVALVRIVASERLIVTLVMEAIRPSETSLLTRATQRHITEDGILEDDVNLELCLPCQALESWLLVRDNCISLYLIILFSVCFFFKWKCVLSSKYLWLLLGSPSLCARVKLHYRKCFPWPI